MVCRGAGEAFEIYECSNARAAATDIDIVFVSCIHVSVVSSLPLRLAKNHFSAGHMCASSWKSSAVAAAPARARPPGPSGQARDHMSP